MSVPSKDFQAQIDKENARLKAACLPVAIEKRRERLTLRATFPPKPGSSHQQPFRQRLSLGLKANPAGLRRAVIEAKKVGAALSAGEFDWKDYLEPVEERETVAHWLAAFEKDYFDRRSRSPQSELTWKTDYKFVFERLPKEKVLTAEILGLSAKLC